MVSVFLAVQTLLVVQGQGWFANWLSILDTARVWLANGREGAGLARAVRLVWEEEQEEIGRIARELDREEAEREAFFASPLYFAGYREDDDGHFVSDSD
jgi:hypothetical protein